MKAPSNPELEGYLRDPAVRAQLRQQLKANSRLPTEQREPMKLLVSTPDGTKTIQVRSIPVRQPG